MNTRYCYTKCPFKGVKLLKYIPGIITKRTNVSYEIEDFVETHLCKLGGILDRAYYGFYVTSSRKLVFIEGGDIYLTISRTPSGFTHGFVTVVGSRKPRYNPVSSPARITGIFKGSRGATIDDFTVS